MKKKYRNTVLTAALALTLGACASVTASDDTDTASLTDKETVTEETAVNTQTETVAEETAAIRTSYTVNTSGILDTSDMFTQRDLEQTADLSEAVYHTLADGETYTITEEGVYVFSGTAEDAEITVDAADEDKVQIVLDGVEITNTDRPAIYVKNADKVFVTTSSDSTLTVTGTFSADGDTNTDAVIFSKDDLVLNGTAVLTVSSADNGITSKDDLKVTGGTYHITCVNDAIEASESIAVVDGEINISTEKDGLHAENDEDNTTGYIFIAGGNITIDAGDDAVHAVTVIQIDGGILDLSGAECLEATYVQINDGTVAISASDDGINAGRRSGAYTAAVEITGGDITIVMGAGDTDGIDSNGNLIISGGTVDITANSPFDYDGTVSYTGGTLIVNGSVTNSVTNQMMGGGMMGGMPGGSGGH